MTDLELQEIERDARRTEQEAIFVASMRDWAAEDDWPFVVSVFSELFNGQPTFYVLGDEIHRFYSLYGWPATFSALATAMQADENAKREAFDRR